VQPGSCYAADAAMWQTVLDYREYLLSEIEGGDVYRRREMNGVRGGKFLSSIDWKRL
jgi:hypothetical protein